MLLTVAARGIDIRTTPAVDTSHPSAVSLREYSACVKTIAAATKVTATRNVNQAHGRGIRQIGRPGVLRVKDWMACSRNRSSLVLTLMADSCVNAVAHAKGISVPFAQKELTKR